MNSVFLIRLVQFILSISLLVLLHEGGHFFFAKLFKVRVTRFYVFFNPKFHLFSTYDTWFRRLFRKKPVVVPEKVVKDEDGNEHKEKEYVGTEYGIGWLPLGGYCAISGMIDETNQKLSEEPKPYEFRTKPAWQRLLIMIGGVLVNFLLALFIYSMVLYHWGESYIQTKDMSMGMKFNTEAKSLGFKDGDVLVGTDKGEFTSFNTDLYRDISEAKRVDIIRDGKAMSLTLPGNINLLEMIKKQPPFVTPFVPAEIDSVLPGTVAEKIGMAKDDKILSINGKAVESWNDFTLEISKLNDIVTAKGTKADSIKGRTVDITFTHHATGVTETKRTMLDTEMRLGVIQKSIWSYYKPIEIKYGFFESFPAGIRYGIDVLRSYVDDLKYVFTSDGAKSLGGFGAIGSLFPPMWDWMMFWRMTAFLSIILAFMNILPIPALDGGHVLFLLYEMITGRKPSERFLVIAEYIGFGLLILLMIVANLNDILRWLGYM
ncbi:MAG: RIP metalloprotease RseP [Prevotella sp.]|nr:RIP metalloprotease RseP [Prevotella sp.]